MAPKPKSARPPAKPAAAAAGTPKAPATAAKPAPGSGEKAGAPSAKKAAAPVSVRAPAREEPFAPATILLLGGYGTVGSAVARTLLEQSSTCTLLLGGRSAEKAASMCKQLNGEFATNQASERAKPITADASDTSALSSCPKFDVLINATTMSAVEGVITLMRLAASKRAHYIDLRGVIGLEEAIAKAVGDVGPVILMGAGYCPGSVAPLLKTAAGRLATCSSAHLSIASSALPSQAEEAIEAIMRGTRLENWKNGEWRPAKPSEASFTRRIDFGDGLVRHTTPVGVYEVRSLPSELSLDECSVRFSSTQDGGLMCAATAVLCCAPCVGLREGISKHLRSAMQRQRAKEPNLCSLLCEATGVDKEGKPRKVVLRASHPAGPAAMAAHCCVAQLTQVLTNAIAGGVPPRMCGVAVDADKLLGTLIKQGVKASIETLDVHASPEYDA
jgi:hypothetical protein